MLLMKINRRAVNVWTAMCAERKRRAENSSMRRSLRCIAVGLEKIMHSAGAIAECSRGFGVREMEIGIAATDRNRVAHTWRGGWGMGTGLKKARKKARARSHECADCGGRPTATSSEGWLPRAERGSAHAQQPL